MYTNQKPQSKDELENEYDLHLRQLRKEYEKLENGEIDQEELEKDVKRIVDYITDIKAISKEFNDSEKRLILEACNEPIMMQQFIAYNIDEVIKNMLEISDHINSIIGAKVSLGFMNDKL